jgi:hypothetical protein
MRKWAIKYRWGIDGREAVLFKVWYIDGKKWAKIVARIKRKHNI